MNTHLVRTRGGAMIHRADCPSVQPRKRVKAPPWQFRSPDGGVPWLWADDKPESVIAWVTVRNGYRTCQHCRPITGELIGRWSV